MQPDVGSRKRAPTRPAAGTPPPAEPNTPQPGSSTRLCQLQQNLCPRQQQVPKAQENETDQKVDQQVVISKALAASHNSTIKMILFYVHQGGAKIDFR